MMWKDYTIEVLKEKPKEVLNKIQDPSTEFADSKVEQNWERIFILADKLSGTFRFTLSKDGK
tara:strand:- start:676 stop:861 length:186 start_codon:yes stop_codon:yes gene_type:complete